MPPPSLRAFLPRADWTSLLASCGTNGTSLQNLISRTHITKRMTALTEYPAREEEFGARARVLPLLRCASARRDRRRAQRSLDLTVRHSNSRRPAAPIPSPKEKRNAQRRSLKVNVKRPRKSVRWNVSECVCVVFKQRSLGVCVKSITLPCACFVKELRRKI